MNISAVSEMFASWAVKKPLVRRVWLFGSRVRGDHRPDSDLDVAIELDPDQYEGLDDSGGLATWMFETKDWKEELQTLVPYKVQLEQCRGAMTPNISKALERSSTLIYEKP